jgi:site-specific recombinase XerD
VNELQEKHGAPGVKQQLAAERMLFDWLVTGQVVPMNPAAAVRGPKHVVKTGKTPVLEAGEWRKLLDSIPATTLRDLRDRALIATLTHSFARITAALKMKVEDLRPRGAGWTVRLHEKGGEHAMPCHHALADASRTYIDAARIAEDRKVEPPGGEPCRHVGPFLDDIPDPERSLSFWHYNTSKRGITLNLQTADGRHQLALRRLARA